MDLMRAEIFGMLVSGDSVSKRSSSSIPDVSDQRLMAVLVPPMSTPTIVPVGFG